MQPGLTSSGTGLAGGDPDFRLYIFRMTSWNLSSPVLKAGSVQSPGILVLTDLQSYCIFITWWAIIWYKGWIRLKITDCCTICFTGVHRNTHQHAIESLQASLETEGECWRSLPGNYGHWADQNGNAAGLCKQEQQWACPDLNKLQHHGQVNWRGWMQLLDGK